MFDPEHGVTVMRNLANKLRFCRLKGYGHPSNLGHVELDILSGRSSLDCGKS